MSRVIVKVVNNWLRWLANETSQLEFKNVRKSKYVHTPLYHKYKQVITKKMHWKPEPR